MNTYIAIHVVCAKYLTLKFRCVVASVHTKKRDELETAGRRERRNASGTQAPASGSRLTATITPTRHLAVFATNLCHLMDFRHTLKSIYRVLF